MELPGSLDLTENDGHNDDLNDDDDGVGVFEVRTLVWRLARTFIPKQGTLASECKCNLHGEAPVTNAVTARRK